MQKEIFWKKAQKWEAVDVTRFTVEVGRSRGLRVLRFLSPRWGLG
jgi:hypothetical protein